jgi:pyruvate dehydrogenase E2 component (dihydrolipoamide acetyltransferase)
MAETISMPKLGFDMREGVLVRWVKQEGESINKGDVIAEIETDKATVEVESSVSGVVRKLIGNQGDSIPVGSAIAIVGSADEIIADGVDTKPGQKEPVQAANNVSSSVVQLPSDVNLVAAGAVKASPLARKVAREARVDLAHVKGTGPGGRIVRRDIAAALLKSEPIVAQAPTGFVSAVEDVVASRGGGVSLVSNQEKIIQTTKLRQAIGRRLIESKQNLPHFYVSHEYNMNAILNLRKQVNDMLPDGEKISVNDFIVKASALALREFPNLNSSLVGSEIHQHGSVNIGVAVTVPGGLLTVVVKNADVKSMRQISVEIRAMAARAREGKVKPDDVDGSTFSTSNLGMYEVENFTAIINPPEAAILAIGSSREVPVVENGQVVAGNRMKCTISVDHRISDGAEAAQFMLTLAKYIEQPVRLLL